MTYKITAASEVAGKNPGETLTDDELAAYNVPALIECGAITPIKQAAPKDKE